MKLRSLIPAVVLGMAVFVQAQTSPDKAKMRTWTSTDGRTIQAVFIGSDATAVSVQRADGKIIKVPLALLSEGDQVWI